MRQKGYGEYMTCCHACPGHWQRPEGVPTLETTAVGNNRRLIGSCCGAARGGRSAVTAPTGQRVYTSAVLRLECSLDCISGSVGHQQNIFRSFSHCQRFF